MERDNTERKITLLELVRMHEGEKPDVSEFKINLSEALRSPDRWNYSFKDESKRLADVHYAKIRRAVERISDRPALIPKEEKFETANEMRKGDTDIIINFGDIGIENPLMDDEDPFNNRYV